MQFVTRKRRQPPAIIIVSLIDVLIVVLIFLMVTTTFKKQPNIKLALPESKQSKPGASENAPLIITIPQNGTFHLGKDPLTLEKLQEKLIEAVRQNPQVTLAINADDGAPFGRIVKVMDAAKAANIRSVSAFTKRAGQQ
jgi:biopolymer transport protein ExbD